MPALPTPPDQKNAESAWPTASMLLLGTFGSSGAGGRRFHAVGWIALAVCLLGSVLSPLIGHALQVNPAALQGALIGATFTFIAYRLWRYLGTLDELARRLQTEAMAVTYLIGMALFMILAGIDIATSWRVAPLWFLALEAVRGVALVWLARRFQ